MVKVVDLVRKYGIHTAVDHISFHLEKGQIYGLLGPNGAGKSTTMKLLTGGLFPTEGAITIAGHDLLLEPETAKRCVGYLPERPPLYGGMTPREYLTFLAEVKGVPKGRRRSEADRVMERTHITHMGDRLIRNLSKGYAQRVGIAQALLGEPQLLVLDEPMVGLDPTQIIEIRNLVKELGQTHTVLFSSHILAEVSTICSRILILSNGKLIADGAAEELRAMAQGQDVLQATVVCPLERAQSLFDGIEGVDRVEISQTEMGQCRVLLYYAPGTEIQNAVLTRLYEADCKIVEMGTRSMSLEDVFLSLLSQNEGEPHGQKGA